MQEKKKFSFQTSRKNYIPKIVFTIFVLSSLAASIVFTAYKENPTFQKAMAGVDWGIGEPKPKPETNPPKPPAPKPPAPEKLDKGKKPGAGAEPCGAGISTSACFCTTTNCYWNDTQGNTYSAKKGSKEYNNLLKAINSGIVKENKSPSGGSYGQIGIDTNNDGKVNLLDQNLDKQTIEKISETLENTSEMMEKIQKTTQAINAYISDTLKNNQTPTASQAIQVCAANYEGTCPQEMVISIVSKINEINKLKRLNTNLEIWLTIQNNNGIYPKESEITSQCQSEGGSALCDKIKENIKNLYISSSILEWANQQIKSNQPITEDSIKDKCLNSGGQNCSELAKSIYSSLTSKFQSQDTDEGKKQYIQQSTSKNDTSNQNSQASSTNKTEDEHEKWRLSQIENSTSNRTNTTNKNTANNTSDHEDWRLSQIENPPSLSNIPTTDNDNPKIPSSQLNQLVEDGILQEEEAKSINTDYNPIPNISLSFYTQTQNPWGNLVVYKTKNGTPVLFRSVACGATTISNIQMIMGLNVLTPPEIYQKYFPNDKNYLLSDIQVINALKEMGLKVDIENLSLQTLGEFANSGQPIILTVDMGANNKNCEGNADCSDHFTLLIKSATDYLGETIFTLQDPLYGELSCKSSGILECRDQAGNLVKYKVYKKIRVGTN